MVSIAGKEPGVSAAGIIQGEFIIINTCMVGAPSQAANCGAAAGQRGGLRNFSARGLGAGHGAGEGAGAGEASARRSWGQRSFATTWRAELSFPKVSLRNFSAPGPAAFSPSYTSCFYYPRPSFFIFPRLPFNSVAVKFCSPAKLFPWDIFS